MGNLIQDMFKFSLEATKLRLTLTVPAKDLDTADFRDTRVFLTAAQILDITGTHLTTGGTVRSQHGLVFGFSIDEFNV